MHIRLKSMLIYTEADNFIGTQNFDFSTGHCWLFTYLFQFETKLSSCVEMDGSNLVDWSLFWHKNVSVGKIIFANVFIINT